MVDETESNDRTGGLSLSLSEAQRRLDEVEDSPLEDEQVERIVRDVVRRDRASGGAFATSAAAAVLGCLLLVSAGFASVVDLWPERADSSATMGDAASIYTFVDESKPLSTRRSALVQTFQRTRSAIRAMRSVQDTDGRLAAAAAERVADVRAALDRRAGRRPPAVPLTMDLRLAIANLGDGSLGYDERRSWLEQVAAFAVTGAHALASAGDLSTAARRDVGIAIEKLRVALVD